MGNIKKTSITVSTKAADVLRNPNASKIQKSLAGSALSQTRSKHQTGSKMEDVASQVLKSNKYNNTTKTLAGSVLSQSNKRR